MSATLELTRRLIALPSITPEDAGCQALLGATLSELGFRVETLQFGEVTNLWAVWGERGPLFVFAGHTDVVPPGNTADWRSDPFEPCERDGYLFGRGAADMKGSLAAMLTATSAFLGAHQPHARIGFLITSDEEGSAVDGTRRVMAELQRRGEQIDYCLVGEPSSSQAVGDTIKIGRRGSLSGRMRVKGIQGHVAYPHLADNPIHKALPALAALSTEVWDNGNAAFPATSFQISNINAGTGATNVVPGHIDVLFNFRFSTEVTADELKDRVRVILDKHGLDWGIDWTLSGNPFLTDRGDLVEACQDAIRAITGLETELSTSGGTSDGRFIAPTGAQVVELGPINATIHKVDERVRCDDLDTLSNLYENIMARLLTRSE